MEFIKFPSIEQFRSTIRDVQHNAAYVGKDENGEPIYDGLRPKPVIKFKGTVKLHGTNAAVCFNTQAGLWFQSRNNIITPEKDNAGFAFFANSKEATFIRIIEEIAERESVDLAENTVVIYGEWCGGNIQKGVALAQLEKMFVIFGVKVASPNESLPNYWVDESGLSCPEDKIYNINDFQTFDIDIDFSHPEQIQNALISITEKVEEECPVGKAFGISGVGEGVVYTATHNGEVYRFKVKGEKHSVTKVKRLAEVNTEKLNSINEFIEYAVTENRMQQMFDEIFPDGMIDRKKLGMFLKAVSNDVIKEESDTLIENGLEPKDIGKYMSDKARTWFFEKETTTT